MKIKVSPVFELGTCGLIDRSYTHCATEICISPNVADIICFAMRFNRHVVMYCHKK